MAGAETLRAILILTLRRHRANRGLATRCAGITCHYAWRTRIVNYCYYLASD